MPIMNMKYVDPFQADVLAALHAIKLHLTGAASEETVTAILWGVAGCEGEGDVFQKDTLPIEGIINLLGGYDCDIACEMRLSEQEAEEYADGLGKLAGKDKDVSRKVPDLLRGMKVIGPLKQCAPIALCLLAERRNTIKKHEAAFIASLIYRPVTLLWKTDSRLAMVIDRIEQEYLSAFKTPGRIRWKDNVEDWAILKKRFLACLDDRFEDHTAFWIDQEAIAYQGHFPRMEETLLALESENLLTIEDIDTKGTLVRWKLRRSPKMKIQGDLPVFRGLETDGGSKLIRNGIEHDRQERFNEGYTFYLWTHLLRNVGKKLSRDGIKAHLETALPEKGKPHDLDKIIEALVQKLVKVSGQSRKEVWRWFERDEQSISLQASRN